MKQKLSVAVLLVAGLVAAGGARATPIGIFEVFASADDGNVPINAIDGDLSTRWSAKGDGHWIEFWLQDCTTVGAVRIAWYKGETRKAFFAIETSDSLDGGWERMFSGESDGLTRGFELFDIEDRLACFVRIVGFGNSSPYRSVAPWNSILEVVIEDAEPERCEPLLVQSN